MCSLYETKEDSGPLCLDFNAYPIIILDIDIRFSTKLAHETTSRIYVHCFNVYEYGIK